MAVCIGQLDIYQVLSLDDLHSAGLSLSNSPQSANPVSLLTPVENRDMCPMKYVCQITLKRLSCFSLSMFSIIRYGSYKLH